MKTFDLTRILIASFFVIALGTISGWIMYPFLASIIWATMIVVATWPLQERLERRLRGKRKTAATIMTLALGLIVLVPLGLAVATLISYSDEVVTLAKNMDHIKIPPPPEWLGSLGGRGVELKAEWQKASQEGLQSVMVKVQPYWRQFTEWALASIGSLGMFVLHLLLTLVISGILFANGDKAARGLIAFARRVANQHGENAIILAGKAIKSVALGIIVTALIQAGLAAIGLFAAQVPYAGVICAAVLIFCIIQLGPLIPMLVGVGWLFYTGQNTAGALLLAWSVMDGILDNFIRPVLIKRGADLPFLLILSGVFGGLLAFGVMGLFIGPVVLAVTYTLLKAWVKTGDAEVDVEEEKDWPKPTPSYQTDAIQYPTEI